MPFVPLLAFDIGDLAQVAIPLIVAVIWVINQLISKVAKPPQNQAPQRPAPQRPALQRERPIQAGPAAGQPAPQPSVHDEIEAFLRRAAQGRGPEPVQEPHRPVVEKPQRPRPPKPATPRPQRAPQGQSPRPSGQRPKASREPEMVAVELVDPSEARGSLGSRGPAHQDLSRLENRHLSERTTTLVSPVEQADENVADHLHSVFDHGLGSLNSGGMPGAAAQPDQAYFAGGAALPAAQVGAAGFAALLANSQNLAQAIVMNEILQRPEHNW
jgi:hypothetical protein